MVYPFVDRVQARDFWSRWEESNTPSADYGSAALTLSYTGGLLNGLPNLGRGRWSVNNGPLSFQVAPGEDPVRGSRHVVLDREPEIDVFL